MTILVQLLLLTSYAVLGIAIVVIPPRAFGMSEQLAGTLGMLVFFGAWQVQSWFMTRRSEADIAARLEKLEDMALILRGDLERTRRHGKQGDEKSDKLVSELKLLHTLLSQVMDREGELKAAGSGRRSGSDEEALQLSADTEKKPKAPVEMTERARKMEAEMAVAPAAAQTPSEKTSAAKSRAGKTAADAAPVAPVSPDVSDMDSASESEIEALDLTPEEAAFAVVDEGSDEVFKEAQGDSGAPASDVQPPPTAGKTTPRGLARKKAPIRLIKREDQLLSVVRSSLAENRVDLYLQPIVALPSRRTVHYECFSRVRDEEGRIILPRQYMKVAESKGLIGTIDNLLLFRLIQLVRRLGKRRPEVRFFCNMSKYSMADEEFFPQFIEFMTANEEFRDRLVFEISQDDYMALDGDVKDRLLTLGRKGFGFSMDLVKDFNQDFALLGDRKFQFIKADMQDLMTANPAEGDVEAVKSFMRRKGMALIVSRIENEESVLQALEARVEFAQGYLFGEPTSANDLNREL